MEVEGSKFGVKLMPMSIGEFDVIIGRDWLVENQVEIRSFKRLTRTPLSDSSTLVIRGEGWKGELAWLTLANSCKDLVKGCVCI